MMKAGRMQFGMLTTPGTWQPFVCCGFRFVPVERIGCYLAAKMRLPTCVNGQDRMVGFKPNAKEMIQLPWNQMLDNGVWFGILLFVLFVIDSTRDAPWLIRTVLSNYSETGDVTGGSEDSRCAYGACTGMADVRFMGTFVYVGYVLLTETRSFQFLVFYWRWLPGQLFAWIARVLYVPNQVGLSRCVWGRDATCRDLWISGRWCRVVPGNGLAIRVAGEMSHWMLPETSRRSQVEHRHLRQSALDRYV